ncbi:MAG: hypothetical protein Q8P15_00020 [Nanoarchaeota archaeon]|nr:hypothetical protein [Nanoarchaeota archaeon]
MQGKQEKDLFLENIKELQKLGFRFTYSGTPKGMKQANAILDLMDEGYRIREVEVTVQTGGEGYPNGYIHCRYKNFDNLIHEFGKKSKLGRWLRDHVPQKFVTFTTERKFDTWEMRTFAYEMSFAHIPRFP